MICFDDYTGEVKTHTASGSRSSLVLRDNAEKTSYWVEERQNKKSEIVYYKNFATNGYLGRSLIIILQLSMHLIFHKLYIFGAQ